MKCPKLHIFFGLYLVLLNLFAVAQEDVKIELGKKNITLDESFTIKVIIKNSDKWQTGQFPDIQSFTKTGKQVSHSQTSIGGQRVLVHTITQSYAPTKDGIFRFNLFSINVNGKDYEADGATISVAKSAESAEEPADLTPIIDSKEEALASLLVSKKQVYVGEGFQVSLVFYVAESNTAAMGFPDNINAQVDAIAKKIKPADCLEDRVMITGEIPKTDVVIANKKYSAYKVFEAFYFPLNNKPIDFGAVELKINKYATDSKGNPIKTQKSVIGFTTKPQNIKVLDLPAHPLRDKVSVGEFSFLESIENRKINTGKSFNYVFRIIGNGNLATVSMPSLQNDSHFDFYPPEFKENKYVGKLGGEKEFRYRIIPKDSGQHSLDKYFYWVYFNSKRQQYDTLKSRIKVSVSGKTIESGSTNSGDIYDGLEKVDTSTIEIDYREVIKNISNLIVIIMLIGMFFVFDFSRKKK
jgi:hypothetical protein